MTVENVTPAITLAYTGPGEYPFSFKAYDVSTIKAYHIDDTGLTSPLTYATEYTVTLNTGTDGGHIDTVAPVASGGVLLIKRESAFEQQVDLVGQGRFSPDTLERALDESVMMLQQLKTTVDGTAVISSWRGPWVTGDIYNAKDLVEGLNGNWYYCLEGHTASALFATDLAAGKWLLALDVVYIDQRAQDASNAAIEAAASEAAAATSESNAATSASTASTQAGIATSGAVTATTQAGIATTKAAEAAASAAEAASLVLVGERSDAIYPDYYVASNGQTQFTITHPTAQENILVFMNSRKLRITDDYTLNSATAASVLTLTSAAEGGEELDIISINTYDLTGSAADMADLLSQTTTQANNAANSASAAAGSASAAAGSASAASTSATNAANSATSSSSYATNSQNSATNSQNSATAAAGSASTATTQAGIATTQAGNAATSATNAANSATAADGSADAAAASAVLADGYADAAAISATEADASTTLLNKKITILQNELLDRCIPAVDKILATTANLVDVFVYNTYEDYDGGKWTENANYQSWYTEQLNTATRGSKREFPKVALIVAETNKVTIYDAAETDCPMWMLFKAESNTYNWWGTGTIVGSVSMLNGYLVVGTTGSGIREISFLKDKCLTRQQAAEGFRCSVGNRNNTGTITVVSESLPYIVNNNCNDVAMTTISRTENAYGLLDPVIAVATDGGVSVIDGPAGVGTVVDRTLSSGGKVTFVSFDNSRLAFLHDDLKEFYITDIPTVDAVQSSTEKYDETTIPAVHTLATNSGYANLLYREGQLSYAPKNTPGYLVKVQEDLTTKANGMVAWISSSYNTGWMKGDIRRAIINDAETIGENLVSNGHFSTDSDWTKGTGWTINGGKANKTAGTASNLYQAALTAGKTYSITATISNYTAGRVYFAAGSASYTTFQYFETNGTFTVVVTPTVNGNLLFYGDASFAGSIDNVIVTEALGNNLVTNGTFTTDTSGWTAGNSAVLSVDTNRLKLVGSTADYPFAYQAVQTVVGRSYSVSADYTHVDGSGRLFIGTSLGQNNLYIGPYTPATGKLTGTFTATTTTTYIHLFNYTQLDNSIAYFDNVIVTEVVYDRSVKASGMTVNGTLGLAPVATDAELMALSGFSASNYLSQPYSADLDFGTGDFYIAGWLKENPNSVIEYILNRAYHSGSWSGSGLVMSIGTTGLLSFTIWDDGFATYDTINTTIAVDDGQWRMFVAQRVGSKLELYINNSKANTDTTIVNATNSLSNSNALLRIGSLVTNGNPIINGSLALLRIGAGSLSADQIAKMYREELALFQPGAKCTIQGSSTAVTALAFNERYNKLLVGTSAGVTAFDNLAVDSNFYSSTANIKALASAGKAVLEANTANAKFTVDNQEFSRYSPKTIETPEGGKAVRMTNRTGAASVKGYLVSASPDYDNSVRLTQISTPDCIGVCYEDGVPDGAEMWVVVSGLADVYFVGSATRGHYARMGFTEDTGEVIGQAISEAVPSAPFTTDKHFAEIGHVLASRTGAGLTKCVLHFN